MEAPQVIPPFLFDSQILADAIKEHQERQQSHWIVGDNLNYKAETGSFDENGIYTPAGRYPFYGLVPKNIDENLKFRAEIIQLGYSSKKAGHELWMMCARDLLFFINAFVWTHDARLVEKDLEVDLPFVTWNTQDQAFYLLDIYLGKFDIDYEKSRDVGGSWGVLSTMDHRFLFGRGFAFLLASYKAYYVDDSENPDCLFYKLDHIHRRLPRFLLPEQDLNRRMNHLQNPMNNAVFDGASTTGDIGRAGRRSAILVDEFATFDTGVDVEVISAVEHATRCTIYLFTPKGRAKAASKLKNMPRIKKIRLHWSEIPHRAQGLYFSKKNQLIIVDRQYPFPPDYPFILDGLWRSPYRDMEDERHPIPFLNRQELDMDDLAENYPFFDITVLNERINQWPRPPERGDLTYDPDRLEPDQLILIDNGRLLLWIPLAAGSKPPEDKKFCAGIDIGLGKAGSQTSHSVISIWDIEERRKVAEIAVNDMGPEAFAEYAVVVCRFFNNAYMIWEDNGPGGLFGKTVYDIGYRNFYYRRNEKDTKYKSGTMPGWFSNRALKMMIFGEYRRAMATGEAVNPSLAALEECRYYVFGPNGEIDYSGDFGNIDPAETGENHGDRVVGDCLGWKGVMEKGGRSKKNSPRSPNKSAPVGSFMHRRLLRQQAEKTNRLDPDPY